MTQVILVLKRIVKVLVVLLAAGEEEGEVGKVEEVGKVGEVEEVGKVEEDKK